MAVQTPYLHADGDINQSKRKRAGEVPGIGDRVAQPTYDPNPSIRNAQASQDAAAQRNAVNGWPAPTGPNPARAQRMQEQSRIPVTGPRGVVQPAPKVPGIADGLAGGGIGGAVERVKNAYSVASPLLYPARTAVDVLTAAPADALRNSVIRAAGGDPATADGGETANADRAFGNLMPAVNLAGSIADTVGRSVKGGVLAATGASPAAPAQQAAPASGSRPAPATATPATAANMPGQSDIPAGNGYTRVGNGIAMRVGADGTPEFTNDAAAVSGASAMPAGGIGGRQAQQSAPGSMVAPDGSRVLASGSNTPDQEFARLGSVANLGNGIGMASFGNDGDSRLAMERFQRANDIRAQAIQDSRRGGIGEGGGRVTVVGDNSWLASRRAPTLAERQRARLDAMGAQTEAVRAGIQEAAATGADTRATNSLTRTKTQQDIATGELALQSAQAVQQLRALMADPSLTDAQRQAAMQSYAALTTPAKDRYILQDTVIASDPITGPKYGKVAIDVLTGRPVAGGIGDGSLGLPAGVSKEQALSQAKAAIASGAPKDAVNRRLQDMGLDPI